MHTALKTSSEKKELFDSDHILDQKISLLAQMILSAEHFVVFTGAGISTGAGIADFRSGVNTVLPTGPGAWEKLAKKHKSKPKVEVDMLEAIPTPAHMALVKLEQEGILKFCISQNVDGLHRRSGFSPLKLAELHGNTNLEVCKNPSCGKQYLRDYWVESDGNDHKTGRKCENCNGPLYDTIINFKENLPEKDLNDGFYHSKKADLVLVLGSSLRVTPAADMPLETINNNGKLVIVNLQPTPLDDYALRINGMIDNVMVKLMEKLNLEIPKFVLKRRMGVRLVEDVVSKKRGLLVRGLDSDGVQYSLFEEVEVNFPRQGENVVMEKEPFVVFPVRSCIEKEEVVRMRLAFRGHYGEPDVYLEVQVEVLGFEQDLVFGMDFDLKVGRWEVYNYFIYN